MTAPRPDTRAQAAEARARAQLDNTRPPQHRHAAPLDHAAATTDNDNQWEGQTR